MATDPETTPGLLSVLRLAISDPGSVLPRGDYNGEPYGEAITHWSARAAAKAVEPFLGEPAPVATLSLPGPDGGKLTALAELHGPHRIYDECGHDGHLACEEAFMYLVCSHCCLDASGEQTEECATAHQHGPELPRCATAAILEGGEVIE